MGFKKEGLLKAGVALSIFCSSFYLIDWVKHHQPIKLEEPKKNLSVSKNFFKELREQPSVHELIPDTLYVQKVRKGSGPRLSEYDLATFHIRGRNLDRETVINTYNTKPIQQKVITTLDGFREGVLGMRRGERRILYVDPSLESKHFNIQNHESPLIYEVELIAFDKTE